MEHKQITKLDGDRKVGVRNGPKYDVNPFIDRLVVKTRGRKVTVARGSTLVDLQTGEIQGMTEIAQVVEVDEGQFVKLFTKDLAFWFDLNKSALRVFGALLVTVQKESIGRDLVFFDYTNDQTKEFGMSKQTFYRGVEELMEKGFIARHRSPGWYFINPAMFFNGNRARFVKEYRKKNDQQIDIFEEMPEALPND
jgi:predicted transcriptional regulator